MSVSLVVTVLVVSVVTALALAPPRRPRPLGAASFVLGLGPGEIPQMVLVVLLLGVVPAIAGGLLGTPAGVALAVVAAVAAAGLVVSACRGYAARAVVQRAVRADLPAPPDRSARLGRWWWVRVLLTPYPLRPWSVKRVANLSYGDAGRRHRLDVYHRRSRPTDAPVLVYFHGGGYSSGGKRREAQALLHRMAARGWVCVSATYRLRPQAGFPDHLVDAKRVIAWARKHAGEYAADPSCLVVAGSSAGGHLASLSALSPNVPVLQPGFEGADTTVSAAVCLYGYYGRYYGRGPGEHPPSTPLALDATGAPPFFLAHGELDTYVDVQAARNLAGHLRAHSPSPVVYAELPGGQHAFDRFRSLRFTAVIEGVEAFCDHVRSTTRRQRTGAQSEGMSTHMAM